MRINLPEDVKIILNKLSDASFEGYIVGGCVRDGLLGIAPKDWDICTNATPEQIIDIFQGYQIIPTGIKHGTVTVIINNNGYEITTYRLDGEYTDSRHPDSVKFTQKLEEDLSRRDFTINAMAYNDEVGLIDPYGGKIDLNLRLIKCVGNPQDRFNEDALRIMRALRFSSVLDFEISIDTIKAITLLYRNLGNIAKERINVEFSKMLMGKKAPYILKQYAGVFLYLFGIFDNTSFQDYIYKVYDFYTGVETIKKIEYENRDLSTFLAILFYNLFDDEKEIETQLYLLRYDTDTIHEVMKLVKYYNQEVVPNNVFVRYMFNKIGVSTFKKWLVMKNADEEMKKNFKQINAVFDTNTLVTLFDYDKECYALSQLAINGNDLIKLGFKPDKTMGIILNNLLFLVMNEELKNDKTELIHYVKRVYGGEQYND